MCQNRIILNSCIATRDHAKGFHFEIFKFYFGCKILYSLRPILLFASMNISRHILELDTSILMKSNMGRREYLILHFLIAL
jgi:hypothetical protein